MSYDCKLESSHFYEQEKITEESSQDKNSVWNLLTFSVKLHKKILNIRMHTHMRNYFKFRHSFMFPNLNVPINITGDIF